MKSVGEILKQARLGKKLTLEDVEKQIKIRPKFLKALEENDYREIPSAVYARGFIKNYSEFLGIPAEKTLVLFRRQFDERRSLGLLPVGLSVPVKNESSPLRVPSVVVFLFLLPLLLLFIYFFREYRSFTQPPPLEIQSPTERALILGGIVEVKGQTDPSSVLTLNGQKIILYPDGTFSQKITLPSGLNTLEFVAKNKLGKETIVKRNIKVNP